MTAMGIRSVQIRNPIILGQALDKKDCVLDLLILLNDDTYINLEMQVRNEGNWDDRSIYFREVMSQTAVLARIFGECRESPISRSLLRDIGPSGAEAMRSGVRRRLSLSKKSVPDRHSRL